MPSKAQQIAETAKSLEAFPISWSAPDRLDRRLSLDDRALLQEWKPAYKRGLAMQAPLAILGFLFGLAACWQTGHLGWALGALLMIANWPVTFFVIMPTNNRLVGMEMAEAGPQSRAMIERWGSLHAVRTGLGFAAALTFIWASLT